MPSRWQIDVVVYEDVNPYPVLLLQPTRSGDHRLLRELLAGAGLAALTEWEWARGLWPLTAGCSVDVSGDRTVALHARGYVLTVRLRSVRPPADWLRAARRQRQVLFLLLPPRPHAQEDELIVDDVSRLNLASERIGCLAGSIPLASR
ncbi:hypothetical protein [Amycolatopsis sp. WQ 127309]|uniref:hypothetical protein n=1 Tax=Amycolatopsis sp. WQ 127309 TaxID=2932773 RepID=UPI001FF4D08C|nr:hypothetical protein [Amycolatopsis sp. WQ 127309]UOZ04915.1 hypothetical protein MUY22_39780 [Amycolatopsis sp. WQ 127309]